MRAADPHFVGVFVEGDDDLEMWHRWLRHRPVPRGGCTAVRQAIADVRARGLAGCVGIVDLDLDHLRACLATDDDILVSQGNDHECDLVSSPAFDTLLATLPQAETALRQLASPHPTLRDALWDRAFPFGMLRWIFRDRNIELPTRLTPNNEDFVNRKTWQLDREKLLATAATSLSISRSALDADFTSRPVLPADQWKVCNGHDVVALLRLALATEPTAAERCRSEKSVAWALRSALDSQHLAAFPIWQQLAAWERRNAPFVARRQQLL
jgi:hypothetical protein